MTPADTSNQRAVPYVGATGWLTSLHNMFQRSVPARVDSEWLAVPGRVSSKFSKANAQQLRTFMQKVGWIDQEGNVLPEGRNLGLKGKPYQDAMRQTVERFYPELLGQIKTASQFTPDDVDLFFNTTTSIGASGRSQMIAVLRWFLREAGLEELEQKVWAAGRRTEPRPPTTRARSNGSARQPSRARTKDTPASPPASDSPAAGQAAKRNDSVDQRLSTISSVLKINMDGTWDEGRMKAALRWLDQLLKGEPVGD